MFRDIFRDPRPKAKSGFMDVGDATYWKGLHLDPSWNVDDLSYMKVRSIKPDQAIWIYLAWPEFEISWVSNST